MSIVIIYFSISGQKMPLQTRIDIELIYMKSVYLKWAQLFKASSTSTHDI